MSRKPVKEGTSQHLRDKQRLEVEVGPLREDGKDWSPAEVDKLLDLYLYGRGLKAIAVTLGRPVATVKNKVWKLATGYRRNATYTPSSDREFPPRTNPPPLNRREIKVIELGLLGEGQVTSKDRTKVVSVEQIARVLNRTVETVQAYVDKKKPTSGGFFP